MRGVNLWREKTDLRRQKGCGEASCPNQDAGQPRQVRSAGKACPAERAFFRTKLPGAEWAARMPAARAMPPRTGFSRPGLSKDRP